MATTHKQIELPADWKNLVGYQPHDIQRVAHASEAWCRFIGGGNRSGKTMMGAAEVALFMMGMHPVRTFQHSKQPPVKVRAVGTDAKAMRRYILPKLYYFIPESEIKKHPNTQDALMELKNGSTLELLTNEMSVLSHGGTDLDAVWFDEEPDQKIYDANLMRLVDRDGWIFLTMTPEVDETRSGISWAYEAIYEKAQKRYYLDNDGKLVVEDREGLVEGYLIEGHEDKPLTVETFEASTFNNPYLQKRVLNFLLKKYSGRERESRIYGRFVQVQARIYWAYTDNLWPMGNLVKAVNDWDGGSPYDPNNVDKFGKHKYWDQGWMFIEVIDPHRVKPWGILHVLRSPHGELYCTKERLNPGDDRSTLDDYARIIKDMREGQEPDVVLIDPSAKTFDPASGSSLYDELNKRGIFCQVADRDEKDWGWSNVNSLLKFEKNGEERPQLFICQDLTVLRWQITHLTTMAWKGRAVIEERGIIREKQREKDNDLTDCIKYACNFFPKQFEIDDVAPAWARKEDEDEDVVINF